MTEYDQFILGQACQYIKVDEDGQAVGKATGFEADGTRIEATVELNGTGIIYRSQLHVIPPRLRTDL